MAEATISLTERILNDPDFDILLDNAKRYLKQIEKERKKGLSFKQKAALTLGAGMAGVGSIAGAAGPGILPIAQVLADSLTHTSTKSPDPAKGLPELTPISSPTPWPTAKLTETPTPTQTPTPEVKTFKKDIFREKIAPKIYEEVAQRRHERYTNDPDFRERVNFALAEDRINVLVTGTAVRSKDPGTEELIEDPLTDSIQFLSFHIPTNTLHIISVPRDLQSPEVLRKTKDPRNSRINQALVEGGVDLLRKAVENMTSLPVDFYLHINSDVLKDFINGTVETIDVNLDREIRDNRYPTEDYGTKSIFYPKGPNTLNGEQVVEVVRSRHQSDDYDRSKRQQKIIEAYLRKFLDSENLLDKLNKLRMAVIADNIWYDKVGKGDIRADFDLNSLFFDSLKKELSLVPAFLSGVKIAQMPTTFSTGITNRNLVGGAGIPGDMFITKVSGGNPNSLNPRRDYWQKTRKFVSDLISNNVGEPPQEEEFKIEISPGGDIKVLPSS